ncbi:MAG TPA: FUN14 domain-containing protein [Candidatus Bathyarchaeia archaeon]|nr:FUN14 domain-containing protein [Candidatus Bathyarchaeia archaeon]
MANGLDLTTLTSVLSVTTFIIGILLGVIIKRAFKLALAIVALVVLLAVTGYLNLAWSMPSANTIYYVFNGAQPVASQAIGLASLLPISSATFLAGAAIGLWKG